MIVDRYYYGQLNKKEQEIYKAFYAGVMEHKDVIPIPVKGKFTEEMFSRIFGAITKDNPLIYYLNQSACNVAQDAFGHVAICPQYFFGIDKIKEYNKKIQTTINELAAKIGLTEGTDYDKELKVHDWLCSNVAYDDKGADMNDPVRVMMSHNIIGVFAYHRAQCEGIAKAMKVLLNAVDVRCIVAIGMADKDGVAENHAWNVVNLGGQPYQVDVTWDIGARCNNNRIAYDYFNVSDDIMNINHKSESILPESTSMDLNYFTRQRLVFDGKSQLLSYIRQAVLSGNKDIYFRLEGRLKVDKLNNDVCEVISKTLFDAGAKDVKLQQTVNEDMNTCWIQIY